MPKTIKEATNEAPPSRSGPRKFYLTQDGFAGDQALSACAEGYHMASLWEIFNTSDLRYDTTLGFTQEDSGSAPPSNRNGWVRMGSSSSVGGPRLRQFRYLGKR